MIRNEKTLVILTPGFAKDEADSTCIPTQQNFITQFKYHYPALNIIILALDYPYSKKTYQWYNNTVISFNGKNKGGLSKLLLRRYVCSTLKKINASNNVIGLLSFWCGECALIGKKFTGANSLKHICWIWGQDAKKNNRYVQRIRPRSDELAVLSDFLQDEFEKNHGIRPQHVVPPGIQDKQFGKEILQRDIDILATGSLIPLKQYEIFIDVVAEMKTHIPDIQAMLIGDGPEKSKLQTLIVNHGLQSNITLTGERAHSVVLKTMQRAKVFLHPSTYEGFGIVCLEALCSGAHVISFVKPMRQEIEHWCIASNRQEMIQKAIEILKNPGSEYKSIIPYRIDESVKKIAQLFSL